ncbi:hypothetical protein SEVIR_9G310900v4 [Setaria viridis]|uniref:(S)-ureidoglycine aminohydrolase cupin domain-containing protein n=3 Tax=Setaria TaxID=4554 RepID=A0A368SME7_SETIT|nr:uncharacterized protein LOC101753794 [Setaria italica]XP_034575034.1 uncharacterized protein LOC117838938 [Setaria viridis]RCV43578.1 hypothetical protein SETIT_9G305300v2 [Setaria italica]TKV94671.1 hypothetical protein SEVIR_9G310900v2 [Setaria viridis]
MRPAATAASTGGFHLVLPASHRRPPPPPSLAISSTRGRGGGRLRAAGEAAPEYDVFSGGGGALLGRPLEDVYKVRVERGAVARARAEALRVMETWSSWRTGGRCRMPWDWQVDQLVYIVSGEVKVIPAGAVHGDDYMHFVAGDLVRYPRWFEADLYFDGPYEERYRFLAYGDDN